MSAHEPPSESSWPLPGTPPGPPVTGSPTPGMPSSRAAAGPWQGYPGGYQTPPAYGQHAGVPAAAGSVDPLDVAALAAGPVALILSFFPYYTYTPTVLSRPECAQITPDTPGASSLVDLCAGDSASAWHGFFGWFGVLLGVGAALLLAAAVFSPQTRLPVQPRPLSLASYLLGLVSALIALVVIPDWPPLHDVFGVSGESSSAYDQRISNGHGFAYWAVLVVLALGAVTASLRHQRMRRAPRPTDSLPPGYGNTAGFGHTPDFNPTPHSGAASGYPAADSHGSERPQGYGAPPGYGRSGPWVPPKPGPGENPSNTNY